MFDGLTARDIIGAILGALLAGPILYGFICAYILLLGGLSV